MPSFSPPAYISVAWAPDGEPTAFVALRQCSGAQLDEALRHATPTEIEVLRNLHTLFKRAGGQDSDTLGPTLKLPPADGKLLKPQFLSGPKMNIGTGDAEWRRRRPWRSN